MAKGGGRLFDGHVGRHRTTDALAEPSDGLYLRDRRVVRSHEHLSPPPGGAAKDAEDELGEIGHVNPRDDAASVPRDAEGSALHAHMKAAPGAVNSRRADDGGTRVAVVALTVESLPSAGLGGVDRRRFVDVAAPRAV